jgi:alkaline phosphatase
MIRTILAAALLAAGIPAAAQSPAPTTAPAGAPTLIVAISVDQFSADLFAEYRGSFTAGLKRLQSGVVFPSGYQSHAATETCPGHSTILTGARPSRSGIVANNWFDLSVARADKKVYCSEDPTVAGSSSDDYTVSAQYLKVPTLGDRMKSANPASRVVSVAGKDRAAVMMGGHATDQIWFWGGKSFVTLKDRTEAAPATIGRVNRALADFVARPMQVKLPAQCVARSVAVPVGTTSVGVIANRKADDIKGVRTAAQFDAAVGDLAIGLLGEMKLGRGPAPDVLAIGLSSTDYVGHAFGTEGAEMCAQLFALDQTVGRILTALDKSGVRYAVVLTADHGGHDLPERNAQRAIADARRVSTDVSPEAIGKAVGAEYGITTPLLFSDGAFGDWYLAKDVDPALRPRLLAAAKAKLLAEPDVAAVFSADELRRMPSPQPPVDEWSLGERARAAFDPERSGDLVIFLKPHVTPFQVRAGGAVATHGSPWGYDRRVPILFYRPGRTGFEQPLSVETVDILPTLAPMIGLPVPKDEVDGRCLDLDPGAGDSCAG